MTKTDVYREYYSTYHGLELKPNVNLPYMRTTTENGVLYFSEFLMLLDIRGELDGLDKARFYKLAKDLQVVPGLYDRGAGESLNVSYLDRRSISHDNITAIASGSVMCNYQFQNDITDYGTSHFFIFNNVQPRKVLPENPGNYSSWFALSNRNTLAYLFLPFMLINMLITRLKNKQDTSARKLYLLELYATSTRKNNFVFKLLAKTFFGGLKKIYGEYFIHELYSIYYPAEHPLVEFSKNIIYKDGKFVVEL